MIKKITENLPLKEEKYMNSTTGLIDQIKPKSKYEKMFKKETEYSTEYEKENPPKSGN